MARRFTISSLGRCPNRNSINLHKGRQDNHKEQVVKATACSVGRPASVALVDHVLACLCSYLRTRASTQPARYRRHCLACKNARLWCFAHEVVCGPADRVADAPLAAQTGAVRCRLSVLPDPMLLLSDFKDLKHAQLMHCVPSVYICTGWHG